MNNLRGLVKIVAIALVVPLAAYIIVFGVSQSITESKLVNVKFVNDTASTIRLRECADKACKITIYDAPKGVINEVVPGKSWQHGFSYSKDEVEWLVTYNANNQSQSCIKVTNQIPLQKGRSLLVLLSSLKPCAQIRD